MATDFGKRVAQARKRAGLTQKELAPKVGMSQSNLSELETVAHESGKTAQIAHVCRVDAYWLATGEGDMLGDLPPTSALTLREPPSLPEALPVVLARLAGLDEYTSGRVLNALQAAVRGTASLSTVEADLLQCLAATQHAPASSSKRRAAA